MVFFKKTIAKFNDLYRFIADPRAKLWQYELSRKYSSVGNLNSVVFRK